MKLLIYLFVLFAIAVSLSAQSSTKQRRPSTSHTDDDVYVSCPEGVKACESVKELWIARDKSVREANWACFEVSGTLRDRELDRFVLITTRTTFSYEPFKSGVSQGVELATLLPLSDPNSQRSWKSLDDSLKASKNDGELNIVRDFRNTNNDSVHMELTLRLSTGRYGASYRWGNFWKSNSVQETGRCVPLQK